MKDGQATAAQTTYSHSSDNQPHQANAIEIGGQMTRRTCLESLCKGATIGAILGPIWSRISDSGNRYLERIIGHEVNKTELESEPLLAKLYEEGKTRSHIEAALTTGSAATLCAAVNSSIDNTNDVIQEALLRSCLAQLEKTNAATVTNSTTTSLNLGFFCPDSLRDKETIFHIDLKDSAVSKKQAAKEVYKGLRVRYFKDDQGNKQNWNGAGVYACNVNGAREINKKEIFIDRGQTLTMHIENPAAN